MSVDSKPSYYPREHMHRMVDAMVPSMAYVPGEDVKKWQEGAKKKLYDLLGIAKIEPYACDAELTIDSETVDEEQGFREIRFRFFSEVGVAVPCHLLVPLTATKPLPVVICLQGHSTGVHISLGRAVYPGDEDDIMGGDRDFAIRTVKEGCVALAMEQRCFGVTKSDCPTKYDCRRGSMFALLVGRTMIGQRVWDIMRAIDVLEANFTQYVDTNKIVCLGNSGGGTATTYASALEPRIKISVPSCAVCRFADSIANIRHCECNYVPGIAQFFDMGELGGMVAPRPIIVVNGEGDIGFPVEGSNRVFDVMKKTYEAYGVADKCYHVIGDDGHRFYADPTWPIIHKLLAEL